MDEKVDEESCSQIEKVCSRILWVALTKFFYISLSRSLITENHRGCSL